MNLATKIKFENILNEAKFAFIAGTPIGIERSILHLEDAIRVAEIEQALIEVAP